MRRSLAAVLFLSGAMLVAVGAAMTAVAIDPGQGTVRWPLLMFGTVLAVCGGLFGCLAAREWL